MQRSDHCDGLVVLVPMVETVRRTDSGWVQNGQNKNKVNRLQIVSGPHMTRHLHYSRLVCDQSELELTVDFWTIGPADSRFGRARYSVKPTPVVIFWVGGLVGPMGAVVRSIGVYRGFSGRNRGLRPWVGLG